MAPEITQEVIKKLEELRDSLQQTENSYATNKCVEILALIVVPERKRLLYSIGMTYNSELKGFYFHNKRDSVFFDWQIEGFDNANFEASFNWFKQNSPNQKKLIEINDGSTQVVSEENLNNINPENFHIVEISKNQNPKQ